MFTDQIRTVGALLAVNLDSEIGDPTLRSAASTEIPSAMTTHPVHARFEFR